MGGGLESEFSVHLWSEASALVWTKLNNKKFQRLDFEFLRQAGAELGQAQVKLDDLVVVVVEVLIDAMVEVELQLLVRVDGWVVG